MQTYDHYDETRMIRTKTTVTDDGYVSSVLIIPDNPIPIAQFSIEKLFLISYPTVKRLTNEQIYGGKVNAVFPPKGE